VVVAVAVLVGGGGTGPRKQAKTADDERHAACGQKSPRHAGTTSCVGRTVGNVFAVMCPGGQWGRSHAIDTPRETLLPRAANVGAVEPVGGLEPT
jgi:hypothetical protein